MTQVSTFLAAVHGCIGQAFFGLMVALCVLTGRGWLSDRPRRATDDPSAAGEVVWSMLGLIAFQIILGAWLRHYGTLAALAHGLIALAVLAQRPVLAARVGTPSEDVAAARSLGAVLGLSTVVQAAFGIGLRLFICCRSTEYPSGHLLPGRCPHGPSDECGAPVAAASVLTLRAFGSLAARPTRRLPPGIDRSQRLPARFGAALNLGGRRLKTAVTSSKPVLEVPRPTPCLLRRWASWPLTSRSPSRRIVVMVLVTVGVGFILGASGNAPPRHAVVHADRHGPGGRRCQCAEPVDGADARCPDETNGKSSSSHGPPDPVPRRPRSAVGLGLLGTVVLLIGANTLAAAVAVSPSFFMCWSTLRSNRWTTLNTAIGADSRRAAAGHRLGGCDGNRSASRRLALFLIVFLWQFPHFLAIAWIYREDYARGGLKMLPEVDPHGYLTAVRPPFYALALSAGRSLAGDGGPGRRLYFVGALVLGTALSVRRRPVLGLRLRIDRAAAAADVVCLFARGSACFLLLNPLPA